MNKYSLKDVISVAGVFVYTPWKDNVMLCEVCFLFSNSYAKS